MKGIKTTRAFYTGIILLGTTSTAHAELQTRLDGRAVYDTDLNITWMSDANLALTNQFGLSLSTVARDLTANTVGSTGQMTWFNANSWIDGMNTTNYLGFSDWRLPTITIAATGEPSNEELALLFYSGFEATGGTSVLNTGTPSELAKFTNIQSSTYWYGTEFRIRPAQAWDFNFNGGSTGTDTKFRTSFAWAARTGDVGGAVDVPEPAGLGLLVSGAMGLLGFTKRRRRLLRA